MPCLSCLGLAALANGGAAIPGSESEYLRFRLADAEAGVVGRANALWGWIALVSMGDVNIDRPVDVEAA